MTNWSTEEYRAKDLVEKIKRKEIRVPPYQRGQVWNQKQGEKLIDSIKKGFPFGTLLLYQKADKTYQLIDGLQRSTTIYNYLNSPAKFFDGDDISDECLDRIFKALNVYGNKTKIEEDIRKLITNWVVDSHPKMQDINNMNVFNCTMIIKDKHPTANIVDINNVLHEYFMDFRNKCQDFSNTEIPAIVYKGDPKNLPEVFNRINSKGTALSKYQILAATWSYKEYKITKDELMPIVDYVNKFYASLEIADFSVDDYDVLKIQKKLNLYQILFGFSKLLSHKYPCLFSPSKKDKDVESCAFNLVNACIGNKNNKVSELNKIIEDMFIDDESFNELLLKILQETESVYKILKPYLEFKLNKRDKNISVYHSELQICSMIANRFNARYCTYTFNNKDIIIGRTVQLDKSKDHFDDFRKAFKKNCFKKYVIDIMNNKWKGSGDSKLDEVSLNRNYYTDDITQLQIEGELDHWHKQVLNDRQEFKKVANPSPIEKLLLSVIYCHSFTAYEQNDDFNYDIEHLAPKGRLRVLLNAFNIKEKSYSLPISSFANLCLLPEEINRKKKDKTLYDDVNYLKIVADKNITLKEIEEKFSYTKKDDLTWINQNYTDFDNLKKDYIDFLNKRFDVQKQIIITNLFPTSKKN